MTESELRLARAAAAEAAALVGPDADAQLLRRRHEQQLVTSLLSPDALQVETAAAALEAEHYLPLRPVCVWVAAPAGPPGEEWSAEALDRLRARLAAKQALCAELEGRLVCLAGVRGLAGNAVMEAFGALTAPRALVGQGEAVEDLREAATSYRRALAALRVAAHEESGTASWDQLGVERVVTALPDSALEDLPDGLAPAAGRRRGARADARGLSRPRGRRQAHGGGAVAAPRRALLPPAPDRGGRRGQPARRRGPAAVPPRAATGAAALRRTQG